MIRRLAALAALAALLAGPARAAEGAIAVSGPAGAPREVTPEELAALPAVAMTVAAEPGHGPAQRSYQGPLLWDVLARAGAVDGAFRDHVREIVTAAGSDGYTVVLALGEVSPEFGNKPVIVATQMDGQRLAPGRFRLVVPGEKRAGRSARDLVSLRVTAPR